MDANQHSSAVIPFPSPKRRREKRRLAPGGEDPDAKVRAIYLRAVVQYLDEIPRQRAEGNHELVRSMRQTALDAAIIAIAQDPVSMIRRLDREANR